MLYERGVIRPDAPTIGLVVTGGCDFHAPVEFPQIIDAGVRVAKIGESSVRYEVGLFPRNRDAPAATGFFVHVQVDRATRAKAMLPAETRAALADLLVG